ncbi:MAG TPA: GAF domain-containing protein [Leptospiraceae bacterium]|nr:GAF domain-containing protein [Leptospiraceae bacterium]HNA07393.1 GAF domain-containing protein [Leptospiraceae bacterium]HNH56464.1 GAF domain-containing protein [Leptospiraceae bacterium]
MQLTQFVISDLPDLESKVSSFAKQINAVYFQLSQAHSFPEHSERFIKVVFYLKKETLQNSQKEIRSLLKYNPNILALLVVNAPPEENIFETTDLENDLFFSNIQDSVPAVFLSKTLVNAFSFLQLRLESFELQYKVNLSTSHISKLTRIGVSLSNEKDFTKLLRDILYSAREISVADSGSLYLIDKDEKGNPKNLRFKISAMDLNSSEFILPINKQSIAGYVAFTGKVLNLPDVYNLPKDVEYSFNRDFDKAKNYHSKSMLVVPMKNYLGEVIGVIQLINRKKNFNSKLSVEQMRGNDVMPFDKYSEELVMSVAGQAAVAIQNNNLIQDIEALFEGFVTASVSAIEARDPTTSGHSFRVALLTVGLAETVDRISVGKFSNIKFTNEQLKEIRYASLLHDFGKVGVREKVLVKSKKLEPYELDLIKWRFHYMVKDLQERFTARKLDYVRKNGNTGFLEFEKALEMEYAIEKKKLDDMLQVIITSNEPTILEQSNSQVLEDISKMNFSFLDGSERPVLTSAELNYLSIRKGSLDFEERKEIESHVEHTFQFLSKIPWTSGLKMVPSIAHAHHEKLNGEGYPRGLIANDIPIQSKMMTIADIFDALTDKDRPYKKAVPLERALDILKMEVKDHHVDGDLLNIFIESRVFERLNTNKQIS